MSSEIKRGSAELTAAMLISGTIGWLVVDSGQSATSVVFWRCLFGSLTLLIICLLLGVFRGQRLTGKQVLLAITGGIVLVCNWLLLFSAFPLASISIATAVYNLQPFILVGLGALFLGEKLTLLKVFWLIAAFGGMLLVVLSGPHDNGGAYYLKGILLALGAAFLYALISLITKQLRGVRPHIIALIQVSVGVLMLLPIVGFTLPHGTTAWFNLITLGVVHTGVMYLLLYGAIQKLPTAIIGSLSFIYPIAAMLVDRVVFHRELTLWQWTGAAIILLAAAGMNLGWRLPSLMRARKSVE